MTKPRPDKFLTQKEANNLPIGTKVIKGYVGRGQFRRFVSGLGKIIGKYKDDATVIKCSPGWYIFEKDELKIDGSM